MKKTWHQFSLLVALICGADVYAHNDPWPFAGHDLGNTRNAASERAIDAGNASSLQLKWAFTTGGDVSATPAVDRNTLYFPDSGGNLFAVDRDSGNAVWSSRIADYTGIAGDYARTTPALRGNMLVLGTQSGKLHGGAWMLGIDKSSGRLLWKTQIDMHPRSIVTQSAVIDGNVAYVGVSSDEEAVAGVAPGYVCCTFRGSVVALNVDTGQILWQTRTVPAGYSGGAVWGSTPVVDKKRNAIYITTGNNYSVPQSVIDCVKAASADRLAAKACIAPDNHFDSVIALDQASGAVRWGSAALDYDTWNFGCIIENPVPAQPNINCPEVEGPDWDFGQGAILFSARQRRNKRVDLVGAGQKSGFYWAFDPDTGTVAWRTQAGPGGPTGGLQWGSAADRQRIYVAIANSAHLDWKLQNGATVRSGGWSALDPATGAIVWQTVDPAGSQAEGAVTVANGVVYGCDTDPSNGYMVAFDASNGRKLWQFASGGTCKAGAAVVDGTVYWGSGYGTPGPRKLYAFTPRLRAVVDVRNLLSDLLDD